MQLVSLNADTLYEYLFERYIGLESNAANLSQDLGIQSRNEAELDIDISPKQVAPAKSGRKTKKVELDEFNFTIKQNLTSLNSNRDNNNSTTGYVLWTTSTFTLKWLLYNENAVLFRRGDDRIKSLLQSRQDENERYVLELGTGISPIFPIAISNYVEKYVATDQKDILPRLKFNIQENQAECRRRVLTSESIELDNLKRRTTTECQLDVTVLDWELFKINDKTQHLLLPDGPSHLTIIAMDVIYNEYLVIPFLNTLKSLFTWYKNLGLSVSGLIGIQLRTEEVVRLFLEELIIERNFEVHAVNEPELNSSRFILLHITLP